jgi:hypothetical protein
MLTQDMGPLINAVSRAPIGPAPKLTRRIPKTAIPAESALSDQRGSLVFE